MSEAIIGAAAIGLVLSLLGFSFVITAPTLGLGLIACLFATTGAAVAHMGGLAGAVIGAILIIGSALCAGLAAIASRGDRTREALQKIATSIEANRAGNP